MNFDEILKNYEERRKELLDHNSNLTGLVLREKEKQADSYLSALMEKFFAAVVSWNLNLGDLKQLGINSVMYSGLGDKQKFASLRAYNIIWNKFIDEIVS